MKILNFKLKRSPLKKQKQLQNEASDRVRLIVEKLINFSFDLKEGGQPAFHQTVKKELFHLAGRIDRVNCRITAKNFYKFQDKIIWGLTKTDS